VERRSNKEILRVTKLIIETVAAQVRQNEQRPGVRELAEHLITSDDRRVPEHRRYPHMFPGHPEYRDVMATVRDCAIFRLWAQAKVVYAMDDLLIEYLSQSSVTSIPTQVFQNLPHANPFVLLPEPDLTDEETLYYRRHIGVPWGAFVFGRYHEAEQLCSTRDEQREDLGLMFVGFLQTDDGPILQTLRCTVPLRERMITVEDTIDRTIARFQFNDDLGEDDPLKLEAWLRTYVAQVFNSLLYICTDQPDVETYRPGINKAGKVKKSGRRQQRRPRLGDIDAIVQLGFRIGPALHQARQQWEREHGRPSAGAGTRQPPHQRRGHFRTYWTGPGRRVPKVNWIAPYWVSQDLLGQEAGPQDVVVRPVRKRK
jgi:hypothetical protein